MIPSTSSSRMMRYSLSSSVISEPEYFPSFSTLPEPTAMTSAVRDFSLAVSGMMMEPTFFASFSSMRLTTILSLIGFIFMNSFLFVWSIRGPLCQGLSLPTRMECSCWRLCDRNRRHSLVCDLLHYLGKQSPDASSPLEPTIGFSVPPFHFQAPVKLVCPEALAFRLHGNSSCRSLFWIMGGHRAVSSNPS